MKKILTIASLVLGLCAEGQVLVVPPVPYGYTNLVTTNTQAGIAPPVTTNFDFYIGTNTQGGQTLSNTSWSVSAVPVNGSSTNFFFYWSFPVSNNVYWAYQLPSQLGIIFSTNNSEIPPLTSDFASQTNYWIQDLHCASITGPSANAVVTYNTNGTWTTVNGALSLSIPYTNFGPGGTWGAFLTNATGVQGPPYTPWALGTSNCLGGWPTNCYVTNLLNASNIVSYRLYALVQEVNHGAQTNGYQLVWTPLIGIPTFHLSAISTATNNYVSWDVQQCTNGSMVPDHFKLERSFDDPATSNTVNWVTLNSTLGGGVRSTNDTAGPVGASYRLTQFLTNGTPVYYNVASTPVIGTSSSIAHVSLLNPLIISSSAGVAGLAVAPLTSSVISPGTVAIAGRDNITGNGAVSIYDSNYTFIAEYPIGTNFFYQNSLVQMYGVPYCAVFDSSGYLYIGSGWAPTAAGSFNAVYNLVKMNPSNGQFVWAQTNCTVANNFCQQGAINPSSITIDNSGNVLLSGIWWGSVNFGNGSLTAYSPAATAPCDFFLAKYNSAGSLQWVKTNGGSGIGFSWTSTKTDSSGNVYVATSVSGTPDFGTGAITTGSNQGYALVKYNSSGTCLWAKYLTSFGRFPTVFMALSSTSRATITSVSTGGTADIGEGNVFMPAGGAVGTFAQWDASGGSGVLPTVITGSTRVWYTNGPSGGGLAIPTGITMDSTGTNLFVSGYYYQSGAFTFGFGLLPRFYPYDVFVLKTDYYFTNGWSRGFGSASTDIGGPIAIDNVGNAVSCGFFGYGVCFDLNCYTNQQGNYIFNLIK